MSNHGTATEALSSVEADPQQRHLHLVEQKALVNEPDYFNELAGFPGEELIDTGEVDEEGKNIIISRALGQIAFGD